MKVRGSYRDPESHVYRNHNRVFRGLKGEQSRFFGSFIDSDFFRQKQSAEIIDSWLIKKNELEQLGLNKKTIDAYDVWAEHQCLDFISYPYEWSFEQYRRAALFHLNLQIDAIQAGFQLKDASAFNIQFKGNMPIFIDLPSFTRYEDGQPWIAYKQFCEMFLAPLLINSYVGVEAQRWLKSNLNGINILDCSRILPWRTHLTPGVFGHIHMQAWASRKITSKTKTISSKKFSVKKEHLISLLQSMAKLITSLKNNTKSYWQDYESSTSYSGELAQEKEALVRKFANTANIQRLLDIGCNAGQFSKVALESGVKEVIGIDIDSGALDKAIQRPGLKGKRFSPLLYDFTNPSPALGWQLEERETLSQRLPACDGLICLAIVHHLVIGKNIPLEDFVKMLVSLAPMGIIEFPTKDDVMVKGLLTQREDIFHDYNVYKFEKILRKLCKVEWLNSKNNTRHFFKFERL